MGGKILIQFYNGIQYKEGWKFRWKRWDAMGDEIRSSFLFPSSESHNMHTSYWSKNWLHSVCEFAIDTYECYTFWYLASSDWNESIIYYIYAAHHLDFTTPNLIMLCEEILGETGLRPWQFFLYRASKWVEPDHVLNDGSKSWWDCGGFVNDHQIVFFTQLYHQWEVQERVLNCCPFWFRAFILIPNVLNMYFDRAIVFHNMMAEAWYYFIWYYLWLVGWSVTSPY